MQHKNFCSTTVPQVEQSLQQLCLDLAPSPQAKLEASPFLQIASVPLRERIVSTEHRYQLLIQPHSIRACGGQFTAEEAHEIAKATKGWDWRLDERDRPNCLPRLEQLLNQILRNQIKAGGSER